MSTPRDQVMRAIKRRASVDEMEQHVRERRCQKQRPDRAPTVLLGLVFGANRRFPNVFPEM